jgi:hypothetical protein
VELKYSIKKQTNKKLLALLFCILNLYLPMYHWYFKFKVEVKLTTHVPIGLYPIKKKNKKKKVLSIIGYLIDLLLINILNGSDIEC